MNRRRTDGSFLQTVSEIVDAGKDKAAFSVSTVKTSDTAERASIQQALVRLLRSCNTSGRAHLYGVDRTVTLPKLHTPQKRIKLLGRKHPSPVLW